jgi:transcription antitermination factor NusG
MLSGICSHVTQKGGALSLTALSFISERLIPSAAGVPHEVCSWFAVQTRSRHEKKVNLGLQEKGVRTFLPLHRQKRQWTDRQQWIEMPLFSQCVFVRISATAESRVSVLRTNGVLRFAGAQGVGTPVPDEQIEHLRAIIRRRIPLAPHEFLKVGERVRIREGALKGIVGIIAAIRNDRSLVVSVDLIQKSIAIRIDGFEVDPA